MPAPLDLFEESGFGRFDPTDFGLTVNLDVALGHSDAAALTRLMILSLHFEIDDSHIQYVASRSGSEAVLAATCFTTFAHEARHFHDLLSTPFGSTLGRLFTRAQFLHGLLWDHVLFQARSLAVPIGAWIANEDQFRRVYPELGPPSSLVRDIETAYADIRHKHSVATSGFVGGGVPHAPSASAILETSAVVVQQLLIAEKFGISVAEAFSAGVLDGPAQNLYFGAHRFIQDAAGSPVPQLVVAFLCTASLFGDALDLDPERMRFPTDILAELLVWLKDRGVPLARIRAAEQIEELVNAYFLDRHGRDLVGMATAAVARNEDMQASLSKTLSRLEETQQRSMTAARDVLDAYEHLAEAQRMFMNSVARYPGDYCGSNYRAMIYRLPKPVIRISTAIGMTVDDELEAVYEIADEDHLVVSATARDHLHGLEYLNDAQRDWLMRAPVNRDGRIVLRNAHVLVPRAELLIDDPGMPNLEGWRGRRVAPAFRLFFEHPDGIPQGELAQVVETLRMAGTALYAEDELPSTEMDLCEFEPEELKLFEWLREAKERGRG